tara:strand:+ start:196 stop:864 length:669 start_codon:yes stop_codon:yes gene_type:complete
MSYLMNVVGGAEPNQTGNIPLDLNNLSDVSTSPATNEFLSYDGAGWVNSTAPAAVKDLASYVEITSTAESVYGASFYNLATNSPFMRICRSVSASGTLAMANSLTDIEIKEKIYNTSSKHIERITISANTHALLCLDVCLAENSASNAYCDWQWQTSTGDALGPIVRVRRTGYNRQSIFGVIETSGSSVDVGIYNITMSGNVGYMQSTETRANFVLTAKFIA